MTCAPFIARQLRLKWPIQKQVTKCDQIEIDYVQ